MNDCAVRSAGAPIAGTMARATGYIVISWKRDVIGCSGYGGAATGIVAIFVRPLASMTTDGVGLIPHSLTIASICGSGAGFLKSSGGSSRTSSLPFLAERY